MTSRLTNPYFLFILAIGLTAALSVSISKKRSDFSEVRREQEAVLAELIMTGREADYLLRKRDELLSNPATIAETAKEEYGYTWDGRESYETHVEGTTAREKNIRVKIVESGWERLLGEGAYLWELPVAAAALSAFFFGILGLINGRKHAAG